MSASNKVAIVTGAGSGIGKAVAVALLHEAGASRWPAAGANRCEQAIAAAGVDTGGALAVPTDVADPDVGARAVRTPTRERFGRLDLLFNNAGIGAPASVRGPDVRAVEERRRHQPDRRRSCARRRRSG